MTNSKRFARLLRATAVAAIAPLAGVACGEGTSGSAGVDPGPIHVPSLPTSDGLLSRAELQVLVDLQVERDGPGLRPFLEDPDPAVRARAALALASVQDASAESALARALEDADPAVRRSAAFALGQIVLADGGRALADALADETHPEVRLRIIEALGKRGDREAVRTLVALLPETEEIRFERMLALSRAAVREARPPGLLAELFRGLEDPDPSLREAAAYAFGRAPNPDPWRGEAARVRALLDGYEDGDPAAMHLVPGLARLVQVAEDEARIARWITAEGDWRVRASAAGAVLHPVWLDSAPVREALWSALDDPSEHVRAAAAGALALALWNRGDDWDRGAERVAGPVSDWRVQIALLPPLAQQGFEALALEWTRRVADEHPFPTVRGIELISAQPGPVVTEFLFELADHPEPAVRAAAFQALQRRWPSEGGAEVDVRRYFTRFVDALGEEANLPVVRAAQALSHPAMLALGGEEALREAFRSRRPEGDRQVLVPILESMGPGSIAFLREVLDDPDPELRRAAAETLLREAGERVPESRWRGPDPERTIDWSELEALGDAPRVRLETERGDLVLRLLPEQAPLTVQSWVEQVREGAHDGVPFHRVMANFVVQGGDVGLGNGSGGPGYEIRSEFTLLPFRRGVLGMASAGKDTEGSQFFLVHSMQPHLDGGYTAFGWLEEGGEVLDALQLGDRVLRAHLLDAAAP